MDDLETATPPVPSSSKVALVTALSLQRQILESNVAYFEDLHGHGVVLVFTNGLQQTRQQAGTDNLEFKGLGVGQLDSGIAVILAVQPAEVLIV